MQISASYCLTLWSVMGKILRLVHESGPRVQSMDQVHEGSPRTSGPRFVVSPLFHEFVLKLKNSSRCRLNVLAGMYCSQCGQSHIVVFSHRFDDIFVSLWKHVLYITQQEGLHGYRS